MFASDHLPADLLEWFEAEPADEPAADLADLRRRFAALPATGLSQGAFLRCVEGFEARVLDVCDRFKPRLANVALPLIPTLHAEVTQLVAALLDVAGAFERAIESQREHWILARLQHHAEYGARALRLVNEAFVLSSLAGAVAPAGLWRRAYALTVASGLPAEAPRAEGAGTATGYEFERLVALAALQPDSLTSRELMWAFEYVESVAGLAQLSAHPLDSARGDYWLVPASDVPPAASVRRAPPATAGVLFFSAHPLAQRAQEQIAWLEARIARLPAAPERNGELLEEEEVLGLPLGLTPVEALSLLRRMRERWSSPPVRASERHASQYPVQVCVGLRAIWEMKRAGGEAAGCGKWWVFNESAGGYAIMSVAGVPNTLSAGMVVALRRDAAQPWAICLVRWIRAQTPEQVELGLQVVAHDCAPVSIAFREGDARETAPGLLLEPLPGLRPNAAILAETGTYASRRFVLMREDGHLYVAQARVVSLDMQTASVELFQYQIDSYPL